MTLTTVFPQTIQEAQLLVSAGSAPTLIANRDTNIALNIGKTPILKQNQYSIIDPLGGRVVSGNFDVYGSAAENTSSTSIIVDVSEGDMSWSPAPSINSEQISLDLSNSVVPNAPTLGNFGFLTPSLIGVTSSNNIFSRAVGDIKSYRIWGITLSVSCSATVAQGISVNIDMFQSSKGTDNLCGMVFQPPANGTPMFGTIFKSYPNGYQVFNASGTIIQLVIPVATGLSVIASAYLDMSTP